MRSSLVAVASAIAAIALVGCGRAEMSARDPTALAGEATIIDVPPVTSDEPLDLGMGEKRLVVLGRRSHLHAYGHDGFLGSHELEFDRWTAQIDPRTATLDVDIDVRSIHSRELFVTGIAKNSMLEADRYPHARLQGVIRPTAQRGVVVIDGTVEVHGRSSHVRFPGRLRREGGALHIACTVEMSRRAFDLRYAPAEAFLDDRFVVSVDAMAKPEQVTVDVLD